MRQDCCTTIRETVDILYFSLRAVLTINLKVTTLLPSVCHNWKGTTSKTTFTGDERWRVCNLRLKKAHQLEMQTSLVMRWMNIQVDLPSEGVKNAYCSGDKIFQCSQPVVRDQSSLSSSRTSRYLWVHHLSVLAIYGDWQIVRRSRLSYLLGFCSTEMEATPTAPILNASTRTPLLLLLVFWSHNSEAQ